jgi:trigger factor
MTGPPSVDSAACMKSAVEPLEGNKVKLSVEVAESEFETALNAAFRRIAREVRIPGFRPGKTPRRVLEARLGPGTGRTEALREALPDYYAQALREHDVDAIAAPEIDITGGQDTGDVQFDAVVEIRPRLELTGYDGLRVTVPNPEVTETDIAARIDRLRANFGELREVDRPAREGDHLTINLGATRGGEPVSGLSVDDYSYELGSGDVLPELDQQLPGAKPGDILKFGAEHPDGAVDLTVLVKDVREKVLPEVTDEWASDASEFDTVEELRADIVRQLSVVKRVQASLAVRNGALEALVGLVEEDPPEALVSGEMERRARDLGHRLESQGASLAKYLEVTNQTQEQLVADLRASSVPAVKADLALRAVADAEGLDVDDATVDAELERMAGSAEVPVASLREQLERSDQMPAVRSDIRKGKALEWLIEHAEVVDEEGHDVDRLLLNPPETSDEAQTDTASSEQSSEPSESGES